ncbi:MAG: sulfotransferase domain-containing protein [Candidatus Aminicenantes bacterium]|nr:sulfotransferase domain-containing protein [Candidatus Aminicenantes bacterium]
MSLDKNTNYIVSGLERSGTSMLMQILHAGGFPMAFDNSTRPPDENNPKGYFELEGGKIINKLMEESFPFDAFKGQFIKITAYGLKFLPRGHYRVIYSERDIEEILDSMEKMARIEDTSRSDTRDVFVKLNKMIKDLIMDREDMDVLFVNYNQILKNPEDSIQKIYDFFNSSDFSLEQMVSCVDQKLYRKKRII